jgi:elongation factor P
VAGKHDAAGRIGTKACPDICLQAVLAWHADDFGAERAQEILDPFDQRQVSKDVLGDSAAYLKVRMKVMLSLFNGVPVAVQLPQRVTFEVVETEPAMKGQTASSSYKPAKLSNGVKCMVPPFIEAGERIVVRTEDSTYVERAKG